MSVSFQVAQYPQRESLIQLLLVARKYLSDAVAMPGLDKRPLWLVDSVTKAPLSETELRQLEHSHAHAYCDSDRGVSDNTWGPMKRRSANLLVTNANAVAIFRPPRPRIRPCSQ